QKHTVFVHVSLSANKQISKSFPPPFPEQGCAAKKQPKKHLFGFDYHVCHIDIMLFKPYFRLNF
ncbi:hypothetical protein, partial [Micromonospora sp. RP3T]|uniref:hypothetical protein n=1 Tax=Micromonospora sp. RP3T TaxID=2135446 RepID=UPI001E3B6111